MKIYNEHEAYLTTDLALNTKHSELELTSLANHNASCRVFSLLTLQYLQEIISPVLTAATQQASSFWFCHPLPAFNIDICPFLATEP